MLAYAESSAVLAWLLQESSEAAVRQALAGAERVVASTLTGVECTRALARGVNIGRLGSAGERAAVQLLQVVSSSWVEIEMTGPVLDRARARFPLEPVRTLDAIHLATAQLLGEVHGGVTLVSLDERIRANGSALGLTIAP